METIIQRYTDIGDPVAYSSAQAVEEDLQKKSKQLGKRICTDKDEIEKKLSRLDAHTLHKSSKKRKKYNPVYVYEKRYLMQADLFSFDRYVRANVGIQHVLLVQDTFTRYVWARPLMNKSVTEVLQKFQQIYRQTGAFKKLWTDRGKEFLASQFKNFCQKNNIEQVFNFTSGHASHVEASGKSLQRLIYKYMTDKNTEKYAHKLPLFIKTLNNRPHRGLGGKMTPAEAELPENVLYVRYEHEKKYASVKRPKTEIYEIGQAVRLTADKAKEKFKRSYKEQNTREIYEIVEVDLTKKIPLYSLRDFFPNAKGEKEDILGKFYANEIVPVTIV